MMSAFVSVGKPKCLITATANPLSTTPFPHHPACRASRLAESLVRVSKVKIAASKAQVPATKPDSSSLQVLAHALTADARSGT